MIDLEAMVDAWEEHLRDNARKPNDPMWVEMYAEWLAFKRDWEEFIYS